MEWSDQFAIKSKRHMSQKVTNWSPKVKKAYEFARRAHSGQKRLTGEDYIFHPLVVAQTIIDWGLDEESICGALLHDTVEDCLITLEQIAKEFNPEIAGIVDGVTKITNIRLVGSSNELFVENLRKMILAMSRDLRVVMVKLADRLHNLQTLYVLPKKSQVQNALETLEIYAPLAERLGMGQVKGDLEDYAFPYAYPKDYKRFIEASRPFYATAQRDITKALHKIQKSLVKVGLTAKVQSRQKRLYSLWCKLNRPGIEGDYVKIYDIVATRIIVNSVSECYEVLGLIHSLYRPDPQIGISDFIAQPKPNGYRSIHTRVFGPSGKIMEVQIRTKEMHEEAERGISAHWFYGSEKGRGASEDFLEKKGVFVPNKLSWVKELTRWQEELTSSEEFLKAVKFDAFSHRNFIFSPRGDVFDLPVNATPVDFAFAVHSGLGRYIKGAKVNDKIVPLDYKLKSGDVVEILKAKNPTKPSSRWLDFVVTINARKEIKKLIQ